MDRGLDRSNVATIERPSPKLLVYYALASLVAGPGFPILFAIRWVRYRTLRYRFDAEGISMSWGILFHREIHLTYSRIQDIHLTSNVLERYLDLARVLIQTASGKAGAEMTIVGLEEHEAVRDHIYARMRGPRSGTAVATPAPRRVPAAADKALLEALDEVGTALRELRRAIGRPSSLTSGDHD